MLQISPTSSPPELYVRSSSRTFSRHISMAPMTCHRITHWSYSLLVLSHRYFLSRFRIGSNLLNDTSEIYSYMHSIMKSLLFFRVLISLTWSVPTYTSTGYLAWSPWTTLWTCPFSQSRPMTSPCGNSNRKISWGKWFGPHYEYDIVNPLLLGRIDVFILYFSKRLRHCTVRCIHNHLPQPTQPRDW